MGGGHEPLAFGRRGRLRLIHDLVGAVLGLVDDLLRAFTRFADDRIRVAARLRQLLLALFGRGETRRDDRPRYAGRELLHAREEGVAIDDQRQTLDDAGVRIGLHGRGEPNDRVE